MSGKPDHILALLGRIALAAAVAVTILLPPSTVTAVAAPGPPPRKLMESTLAGRWYEADKAKLAAEIDGYLANVPEDPLNDVMALIMPHAGYRYSGQTAAYAANRTRKQRWIVLSTTWS